MLPLTLAVLSLIAAVAYCTIEVRGLWRDTHEEFAERGDWKLPVRK